MNGERWPHAFLAFATVFLAVYAPLPAQGPVRISKVRQLDMGMQFCQGNEPMYQVSLRNGITPRLEFLVVLKPAPDEATEQEIPIRVELVDAEGRAVEMADSTRSAARFDPPWLYRQTGQIAQHILTLENRRPKRPVGYRFRIRVSIDSTDVVRESPVFLLFWSEESEAELCSKQLQLAPPSRRGS